jgi:tripartite ATP-independent transporter DctP family solute receptor
MTQTRRTFLKTMSVASAALAGGFYASRASAAAEFTLKYANNLPLTHPMNARAKEMAEAIAKESNGRVELRIYPTSQLGNDTDTLGQVRAGAVDFFTLSPLILGTLVPAAQISGVGFAFKDYKQVYSALDGELGAHVRAQIAKTSIFAFENIWDNGYRVTTTSTRPITKPEDFKGMKLRVPPSPLWTSMFKGFEASPSSINFAETYSALQTKIVEGQENPMAIIETAKLYEVQKYLSITNHMWDGFWFLGNKKSFERLPQDLQDIVRKNVNAAGLKQREDVAKLNAGLTETLKGHGLAVNEVNPELFRDKLRSAGFYSEWKKKFGDDAWALLEKVTGKLE